MSPPNAKKAKIDLEALCPVVWEHFRQYLDSIEENDGEGDIDELQEIIELAEEHVKYSDDSSWTSVVDLIPILLSVAYNTLADLAINEYLSTRDDMQSDQGDTESDGAKQVQSLLIKSLDFYPENAATWSMGANFGRITNQLSPSICRQWYECAVESASRLRPKALGILEDEDVEDLLLKEWIELLVLNQVVGVEFVALEGENEEGEEDLEADDKNSEEKEKDDEDNEEGQYSASTVESTASFMCAMLWSMVDHDKALSHLKRLPVTHRLHPNVWTVRSEAPDRPVSKAPLAFRPEDGILPQGLYASMKETFAPDAVYWNESDYSNRGYYSYFVDYQINQAPRNHIEDAIINYLLPRAKQMLSKADAESICGFEWWVHTRPIKANLGHNLHFDTDEAMLAQEKKATHPILSSVLYLTGGDDDNKGGTTIIIDQTPDSKEVADSAWLSAPMDNSFVLFPGNLLHGVLPCPGRGQPDDKEGNVPQSRKTLIQSWRDPPKEETSNRLTFMVGFWTRSVPGSMKERRLYGPCGPLPPATDEHSWVKNISKGYNKASRVERIGTGSAIPASPLLNVSPAWEVIDCVDEATSEELQLEIPHTIDHRFFVRNAPECFRDSLFEDNDDEAC